MVRPDHVYLDLDRTLFDTETFLQVLRDVVAKLFGVSSDQFKDEVPSFYRHDGDLRYYDFFAHLASHGVTQDQALSQLRPIFLQHDFLFRDVSELLHFLSKNHFTASVLTYGPHDFQNLKFSLLPLLHGLEIKDTLGQKGDYIAAQGSGTSLLIDDKINANLPDGCEQWLLDRTQKEPVTNRDGLVCINSLDAARTLLEPLVEYNESKSAIGNKTMKPTKAIIPVAGYGTRRLPVSKAIEKCMLPVLNRPIVDYIVQDCIKAGIRDFYFVMNPDATQLESYYSHNQKLADYLQHAGKDQMLPLIEPPADCNFHFIKQPLDQYGTTVPVWMCREFIQPDEQVLVIMGDQFFYNPDGGSEAASFLAEAQAAGTPSAMLAVEVPHEEVSKYGIVSLHQDGERELYDSIVEKPRIEDAPTNLNNGSFYLFNHDIFDFIEKGMSKPDKSGEYFIIDALNDYVAAGNDVAVVRNKGEYLDCGTVEGWLHANNRLAEK